MLLHRPQVAAKRLIDTLCASLVLSCDLNLYEASMRHNPIHPRRHSNFGDRS